MSEVTRLGNEILFSADITGTRVPSGMGITLRTTTVLFTTVSADYSRIRVFAKANTHVASFFLPVEKIGLLLAT